MKFGAVRISHFTGARLTHVTYQGVCEDNEQTRSLCPHEGHRTINAAAKCIALIYRRKKAA